MNREVLEKEIKEVRKELDKLGKLFKKLKPFNGKDFFPGTSWLGNKNTNAKLFDVFSVGDCLKKVNKQTSKINYKVLKYNKKHVNKIN